jgi:sugar phosphate permease
VYGLDRVTAANHASLLLFGVATGSLLCGHISDRLRNRRAVLLVYSGLYVLSWTPWILGSPLPLAASYAAFLVMGLLIPGFVLTWAAAKEVNAPQLSGMATGVVNVGIFLGAGILQPLVGWVVDSAHAAGLGAGAMIQGARLLAAFALFGWLSGWALTETRARNVAPAGVT